MERYRKKEMLQTVETLLRANDAIVKTARSNPQGTAEALVQCQESAIALGTAIETFDEKYANLVQILEDYCENLYQMSEGLSDETLCRKVGKKIQKQLTTLQNGIKYDMPEDRKEIVFLPYKASMWDSLESVWRAAEKDPDCDAYVIPIPYYVKAPDGSLNEEVYEGDQFPKDVPITRYDEYDLEARRPDAIYIHNPYDECNHVTSVHPYFYAKNLKNFTEKLVYIPYFILKEIKPDDQSAIDGMKHFCFLPGTLYADQVILQSEDMRQIYINEYIKAAKDMELTGEHIDRRFLEKKFLGTGSPKVEKLLNTKKEELEIPEAWRRIIEKPDGSWKKIIFYNISVSALLHDEEKLLQKMESVFEIFKENRDEVVLLWRPHPLIQSTIESMRPKLWEAYAQLKDRYIEEGWGIYDDSADIDRAIILSDAYYGVGSSSVVQLYQKTGKLVMIQDADVGKEKLLDKNDNYVKDSLIDAVLYNDKVWFCTDGVNALFSVDMASGDVVLEAELPGECYGTHRLYNAMRRVGTKIFFVPFYARDIAVYDVNSKEFQTIELDEGILQCKLGMPLFTGGEIWGEYLFCFTGYGNALVRLNTRTHQVNYVSDWINEIKGLICNEDVYFGGKSVVLQDKLMIPFCNVNAVLSLNPETMEWRIHQLGTEGRRYIGICFDGINYWLLSQDSSDFPNLVKWSPQMSFAETVNPDKLKVMQPSRGCGIFYQANKMIVFLTGDEAKRIEAHDINTVILQGFYSFIKEEKDDLLLYRNDLGKVIMIDKENGNRSELEICIKCKDMKDLYSKSKDMIRETENFSLLNLIKMVL